MLGEGECYHFYIVVDSGVAGNRHPQGKCANPPCWITYFCYVEQMLCQNCSHAYVKDVICGYYEVHTHPSIRCSWGK